MANTALLSNKPAAPTAKTPTACTPRRCLLFDNSLLDFYNLMYV